MEVTYLGVFLAGLATFFAPCTFVTLPTFISYLALVATSKVDHNQKIKHKLIIVISSISYILGFLLVFTLLGMAATWAGGFLRQNQYLFKLLGGIVIALMGIFILFGDKIKLLQGLFREQKFKLQVDTLSKGYLAPFLIGTTSAFAWTPCVGPILGSVLFLASSSTTSWQGGALLFVYGLGINIPFLLLALGFSYADKFIHRFKRYSRLIYQFSALVLILIGILLILNLDGRIFGILLRVFISLGYSPK